MYTYRYAIYIYIYLRIYLRTYVYTYVPTYIPTYLRIYIYIRSDIVPHPGARGLYRKVATGEKRQRWKAAPQEPPRGNTGVKLQPQVLTYAQCVYLGSVHMADQSRSRDKHVSMRMAQRHRHGVSWRSQSTHGNHRMPHELLRSYSEFTQGNSG
jgi:hypothetical protein